MIKLISYRPVSRPNHPERSFHLQVWLLGSFATIGLMGGGTGLPQAVAKVEVKSQNVGGAKALVLENDLSRVIIDQDRFTLIDLVDVRSNTGYVVQPGGALFSLAFKSKATRFYETPVTYTIDGSGAGKRTYKILTSGNSKTLELHYDASPIGQIGGSADAVVSITAIDGDPVFKWNFRVKSGVRMALGELRFPTLQGLGSKAPGSAAKDYLILPITSGRRVDNPRAKAQITQGAVEYPGGGAQVQLMSYNDGLNQGGLYFAAEDAGFYRKTFLATSMASGKAFQWHVLHYPDGETPEMSPWSLPYAVACGPIQGDWYDAAKMYRKWLIPARKLKTIANRDDIPDWFKNTNIWFQGQDRNPSSLLMTNHVARLLQLRKQLGEPFAFHWYLWQKGKSMDVNYPDYFPAEPGFKEAVAKLREGGVWVMPYINVELFDTNLPMWKDEKAIEAASRDINGNLNKFGAWTETSKGPKMVNMSPSAPYWQEKMVSTINRLVQEYDVDAVYLDELHVFPFFDYSTSNGHKDIGGNYFINGYRKIIERAKAENGKKQLVLTGEQGSETYADLIAGQLEESDYYSTSIPLFQSVMKDYTVEFGMQMRRAEYTNIDSYAAKTGLMLVRGRQLGWVNFDQFYAGPEQNTTIYTPKAAEPALDFLRAAAKCRTAARDFLLYGEYLRDPKLVNPGKHTVQWWSHSAATATEIPNVWTAAYKAPNGDIGLVLVNTTSQPIQAEVTVNNKDWGLRSGVSYARSDWQQEKWSAPIATKLGATLPVNLPVYTPVVIKLQKASLSN